MMPRSLSMLALLAFAPISFAQDQKLADAITQEATRPNRGDAGRPLPLAGHWNVTGMYNEGFTPAYQLSLLKKGHHLLPWLEWPITDRDLDRNFKLNDPRRPKYIDERMKYFETTIKELARLKLPISFLGTQWESVLTYDKDFFDLPADKNPNVIGLDGKPKRQVCPFGPVEPWRELGKIWLDTTLMRKLQEWYPDPPLVLFISNNEHAKQQWSEAEQSKRYLDKFGPGKSGEFKRKVIADGWIERYGAMLESMRASLTSKTWRKNVRFVGYEAFPPVHFGRWGGWKEYSLTTKDRLDPQPLVWDGGSPSYYLHNWMAITDYTLWSPQIETMNWVFMLDEIHKTRPNFWFELSTWDGDQPGAGNDKRKFYAKLGEPWTPARYEGMIQFGMWLMRPRVVRDFRSHTESVEYAGPYFKPILDSIDRVWEEPILQRFWRHGTLVANPKGKHPYQADVPAEYKNAERWFLLEASVNPKSLAPEEFDNAKPPARQLEIPVFALAYVLGEKPSRQWLVYAHAPRYTRTKVAITVPGFGPITVDVPQSGSFFYVKEMGKAAATVVQGGPASFRLDGPRFVEVGAPAAFTISEGNYPVGGGVSHSMEYKFTTDTVSYQGDSDMKVSHQYGKKGQYFVTVTGTDQTIDKVVARKQLPVLVGMKPEKDVVCRLLMKGALDQQPMKSWIWHGGWDKVDYTFIPDASGANNLGFLAGGKWVKDEQRGLVLELNGQRDRVEIMNTPEINAGKTYPNRTVAFWFRATGPEKDDKKKAIRSVLYEEGGSGAGLNVYLDGSMLRAGVWNQGKGEWLQSKEIDRTAWHHVAFVLQSENAELYLDGAKIADGMIPLLGVHTGDINLGRSGSTRFLGRADDNPGYYFAGRFDDFRIINRALSKEEVQALQKEPRTK
jgi:hypothetical protein